MSFKRHQQLPQKQISKLQGIKKVTTAITIIIIILIIIVISIIVGTAIIIFIIRYCYYRYCYLLHYCQIIQVDIPVYSRYKFLVFFANLFFLKLFYLPKQTFANF